MLQPPEERAALSAPLRAAFSVPNAEAELARAWLVERYPKGFEEREGAETIEFAVYTDAAGLDGLRSAFPQAIAEPVADGWEDRWKEFHQPVVVGGLWIGPPWITPPPGMAAVVVDPGRAFGTGAHPTTRACIELLSRVGRGSLLDAGCGSGVVAVAAARLGFRPVRAVDLDEVAVEVAAVTAEENGVDVDVSQVDVLVDELPAVDVLVANIELGVVQPLLERARAPVAVTSGYLASERPTAPGWRSASRLELEGWVADVLVAK